MGDGGRGNNRGLMAFQAALTRSIRHAAFAIQLPPSAIVVSTSHCNRRGRWRKGEQPRPNGGLRGCQATRQATSATPCAAAGLSTHRRPPPPNPAAVPPNPAALHCLSVGSNLLAMPGAASPPHVASPLMGTSPNRIYRLAAQLAPSDLLPAAQHKKNSPLDADASTAP
jgi:hypothetical protein